MNIKIVIVTHKPYWMPSDDVYLPLHVGKALHPDIDLGIETDDTGDNISSKNASYCELTGLYWAWKNLKADYKGLVHYRRHFVRKGMFSTKDDVFRRVYFEKILSSADILLPHKCHYYIVFASGENRQIESGENNQFGSDKKSQF